MAARLLLLNGLAACAVAINHAASYGLLAMFQWTDRYLPVTVPNYSQIGTPAYYFLLYIRMLISFGVPAFLFISGFFIAFMARGSRTQVGWQMVMPRVKILIVPFLIWTLIRYMLLTRIPTTIDEILDPYYFIPVLAQFYLLSPILVPLARNRWKLLLAVCGLIYIGLITMGYLRILGVNIPSLGIPRWIFLTQPFWFPFGVVAGLHMQTFRQALAPLKWKLLTALTILAILPLIEHQTVAYLLDRDWLGPHFGGFLRILYHFVVILCFLAFDKIELPFSKAISNLAPKSLGIYLGNIPFVYVTSVLMYFNTPWILGNQLLYQIILIMAGLGGPVLLMTMLMKSPARPAYRYVFG
jgi:peptidoglycan/LPS O-acetylase OafA/YrhL